ncbi:methyltransferase domain-containing protein [Candidatus Pacearchaeota archaeon]|nr:methyltransferase domain-containing protein [Candidatus Pacearchaeota archaeon]
MKISYDILGNVIIAKFPDEAKKPEKIKEANKLLKEKKSVETILEKKEKVKGRLRTIKTNYLAGKKNKEALYLENGCRFKFNVETCYFSPRLSNERKEIYQQVKKNEKVLVMFGGVAPYAIVIAKNSKPEVVYSVELGKECNKYAKQNVILNRVNNVRIIQGDVKKVIPKLSKEKLKFDIIIMPRPNLKDSFLNSAFQVIKKNGIINYYGFSYNSNEIVQNIQNEAKKAKKIIKIIKVKKAGDIAPYKFRWRVDFKVLN